MPQRGEEEGAESALARINSAQKTPFQQLREERLREVLSIFRGMTAPPNVGVKRIPIGAAQPFQSRLSGLTGTLSCSEDHAPMSGSKPLPLGVSGTLLLRPAH